MMIFGERLKQLREGKYSQEELADKMNIHNNTISKWENGTQEPRAKRVTELARILGTSTAYLLGDTDNPDPVATPRKSKTEANGRDISMEDKAGHLVFKSGDLTVDLPDTPENKTLYWQVIEKILSHSPAVTMA